MTRILIICIVFFSSQMGFAEKKSCPRKDQNIVLHEIGMHIETFHYWRNCNVKMLELKHFNKRGERHNKKRVYFRRDGSRQRSTFIIDHQVLIDTYYDRRGDVIHTQTYSSRYGH